MFKNFALKRTLFFICTLLLLAPWTPLPASAAVREGTEDYKGREILIRFEEGQAEQGRREVNVLPGIGKQEYFDDYALLTLKTDGQLESALDRLEAMDSVGAYQPNYQYVLTDTNPASEPDFELLWWLHNDGTFTAKTRYSELTYRGRQAVEDVDIDAPEAWAFYSDKSREVLVAVLDTGIDVSHPELKDIIWKNKDEKADGRDSDNNGYEDDLNGWNFFNGTNDVTQGSSGENDHGTHVAGIIAAQANGAGIAGVASNINVKVMPVKVLGGKDGVGSTSDIIKGILYAEDNGAVICNMSFGEDWNDALLKTAMSTSSMLFVAAAGNGSSYTQGKGYNIDRLPSYPSSYHLDNTVSVANIGWDGALAPSSCYGENTVDLAAPGADIYSTITGGEYSYMTGTSMAAPMVTGTAAVAYSYYGGLTAAQLKEILCATVKKLPDLDGKVITGGIVDLYNVLTSADISKIVDKTAPGIKTAEKPVSGSYKKKLTVEISDKADNLKTVYYARGRHDKAFFTKELAGTPIPVNGSRASKTLTVSNTGSYTFYAVDENGNDTLLTKKVEIKTVKLNAASKTLKKGGSFTAKGAISPSSAGGRITYKSSNPKVARVDKNTGKITAVKKGRAVITAGVKNGKSAVLKITVK